MKKLLGLCTVLGVTACLLAGCGDKEKIKLDPNNPVSIDLWHYYSGNQKDAFDNLIKEFNSTVGVEKGIVVDGVNCGGVQELSAKIEDTVKKKAGTDEMPSIFQGYANDVYQIDKLDILVNLEDYFTQEELKEYDPAYIEEGRIGEKDELKILPTAKSTEILLLNKTAWDKFAADTGAEISLLSTIEGLIKVSEQYYEWSDGKAFFGRDALANYLLIGAKQLGTEIFQVENGKVNFNLDPTVMKKLWDGYYSPYIKGYFGAYGKFRTDDAKVGDILALVGSTSSVTYFPKEVFIDDKSSYPVEPWALETPIFEGGERYVVQQGAGMAVVKSTPEEEYASAEFLRWFTQEERNMSFSMASGYLPVKTAAKKLDKLETSLSEAGESAVEPIMKSTLMNAFKMSDNYKFYTPKAFEGSEDARNVLESSLSDKIKADKAEMDILIEQGEKRDDLIAKYDTQENFEEWLEDLKVKLEQTQK